MPHIWRACTMVNTRVRPRVHRLSNAWGNTSRTCPQILGYQSGVGRLSNDLLRKALLKSLKYFTSRLLFIIRQMARKDACERRWQLSHAVTTALLPHSEDVAEP